MKRLRDPVHDYVLLDDLALALVDRPEFQRLRNVRQLGTVHLVYPGANHSRFEHCVGAHHLARMATEELSLPERDAAHVRAAVLLHDVGHGPFSHLSEEIVKRETGRGHVRIGCDLLLDGPLGDVLRDHGLEPARVAELVAGKGELGKLVSGELDVDRMDYLARDSHYTGVTVGLDVERIVSKLLWTKGRLALHEEGLAAAETLLVTRFLMYTAVYFHHTCRAAEMMLRQAIDAALAEGLLSGEELSRMDDVALLARLRSGADASRRWLARVEERRLHKLAFEATFAQAGRDAIARHGGHDGRRRLEAALASEAGVPEEDVLVDVPEPPILQEVDVRIVGPSGERPIVEASKIVGILREAQMDHWRLRVYADAAAREKVAQAAPRVLAQAR
ncbi:MAG TPA: HD domain-containing protein [Candidatus Thermoplasmatota archaeon]|nr:HD domain-containing protein [Candidatus Thermoplasmatota archaeon]